MNAKPLLWVGASRDDLRNLPGAVRRELGFDLRRVQLGEMPRDWKAMAAVGPGVIEIRVRLGGAYRLLYIAKFAEAIYILHVFQKKTQQTAALDLELARARFKSVRRDRKER
jgi:phage-related protein